MSHKPLKFIDLFAGLGGFHLALSSLGCECVFASELKSDLRSLYNVNFPGVKVGGDITTIAEADVPEHDVLCAGFPCQPFSQAGKRRGFNDEGRGNLFYEICRILRYHKPEFIILENVSNLLGHDGGNTWRTIKSELDSLSYDVSCAVLSPHEFGIPQHRKRIYIVGRLQSQGGLAGFSFPEKNMSSVCDIRKVLSLRPKDPVRLSPMVKSRLAVWQDFVDGCVKHGQQLPGFPIWAMEFGATYDFHDVAPAFQSRDQLVGKRGNLGELVSGDTKEDCLAMLPVYARTASSPVFPKWKIRYIEENRSFYQRNKEWIDPWLQQIKGWDNSHQKFEWNCGKATPMINDKIVQFRASGIRVKMPTFAPALNLVGTQTPIFPWLNRYMTVDEAAKLQGMEALNFKGGDVELSKTRALEALGNAVNVEVVRRIATNLLSLRQE